MAKNYLDETELERKDENEIMDHYEKGRTGHRDGGSPLENNHEQQFPGDEIVEDLRELSRQDEDPAFTKGENIQQEPDRPRFGDSISKNADQKEKVPSSDCQNERNYQNSNNGRNSD